ncbi:hypothetical protein BECAL_00718 [Bellilinea caldifistulae]|uniref:hypothetical protein n=1 Tax=Bellilinea caldifistulae TaxID=360411 RepID=UPI0012F94089|nr:hypothetical protein [Bellilinea caldifistulae]GAP09574.1 hypothetical protein BECAL_00718 [Bellilinea caldifistulae]
MVKIDRTPRLAIARLTPRSWFMVEQRLNQHSGLDYGWCFALPPVEKTIIVQSSW